MDELLHVVGGATTFRGRGYHIKGKNFPGFYLQGEWLLASEGGVTTFIGEGYYLQGEGLLPLGGGVTTFRGRGY